MTLRTARHRGWVTAFVLVFLVAACASPQSPTSMVEVPDKLKPGANESVAMIAAAKGVQIYECRVRKDRAGEYEWAFVAPEADLFDARGSKIGRHYAGPQWESTDGSKIAGTLKASVDAPAAGAIPWLLLAAMSVGPEGSFSKVTSIQRMNTSALVPPSRGGLHPRAASLETLLRQREGLLRDRLFVDGTYRNVLMFALFDEEWRRAGRDHGSS